MKIHLVRHTKPAIAEGICYGQTDLEVGDSFEKECTILHKKFAQANIDQIFSSPLIRCAKLAESFVPMFGEVRYDNRLMEFNFGEWEMKTWSEIELDPGSILWFSDYINLPVPGGESFMDLIYRIRELINEVLREFEGQNLMIICHGGVIRAFDAILKGKKPMEVFDQCIDFGGILTFELDHFP